MRDCLIQENVKDDIKLGEKGEEIFARTVNFLNPKPKPYNTCPYDLTIELFGKTLTVEVKYDNQRDFGNYFFETISNKNINQPEVGGIHRAHRDNVDVFAYGFEFMNDGFFIFDVNELFERVEAIIASKKYTQKSVYNGKSLGYAIPRREFNDIVKISVPETFIHYKNQGWFS